MCVAISRYTFTSVAVNCITYLHIFVWSYFDFDPSKPQGHSEELWGMASHPQTPLAVTAGYDQQVCKWDLLSNRLLWKIPIEVRA